MAIYDLDQVLSHLEDGAEDELALLESTGPAFYSTGDLLRLRGQWEIKNQLFRTYNRLLLGTVAISPIWIGLYFLADLLGWRYLSLLFLALFPLSFVIFFAGLLFMRRYFRGKGHLDNVGEMIVTELRRRIRHEQ